MENIETTTVTCQCKGCVASAGPQGLRAKVRSTWLDRKRDKATIHGWVVIANNPLLSMAQNIQAAGPWKV